MTKPRPSYLSDPTIQHLSRVLEEIHAGLLAFPRFQRPFVWKPEQRLELLRSVLRGLPIGTFMTWRTTIEVNVHLSLGPIPLKQADPSQRQYVLDGLQRLTSLYTELIAPHDEPTERAQGDEPEGVPAPIWVDLREEIDDPALLDEDDHGFEDCQATGLRLADAFDSKRLLRRLRELDALPDGARLVERADAIAQQLREYKVPIVPYVSDDPTEVARAFQLINSQGTPMSDVHMVNALAWAHGVHFLDTLGGCRDALSDVGWELLDETVMLRCFAVVAGFKAYEYDPAKLGKKLVDRSITDSVVAGLCRVATVLHEASGIFAPELVPYSPQIVVLFSALHRLGPDATISGELVDAWLWYTTYIEAFSGAINASMIERVTGELHDALAGRPFIWQHRARNQRRRLPPTFDFRHARGRALAMLLARQQKDSWNREHAIGLTGFYGAKAMVNLLPSDQRGKAWSRGVGARFLVDRRQSREFRAHLAQGIEMVEHAVTPEAAQCYANGDFEGFVKRRTERINELEQQHFDEVKERLGLRE
jgi:hypothetical protein